MTRNVIKWLKMVLLSDQELVEALMALVLLEMLYFQHQKNYLHQ